MFKHVLDGRLSAVLIAVTDADNLDVLALRDDHVVEAQASLAQADQSHLKLCH